MVNSEVVLSVFDKSVEVGPGWEADDTRASGYRKCYFSVNAGAKIKVHFNGCAISLLRGSVWHALPIQDGVDYDMPAHPNPWRPVGSIETEEFSIKLDGGVSRKIDLTTAPLEIPLAENLVMGEHHLEIVAASPGLTTILGFRVMKSAYGTIAGVINAERELYLNDVDVTIWKEEVVFDKRLSRNPFTRELLLWGLPEGSYDLEIEALGWETSSIKQVIVKSGKKTTFSDIHLKAEMTKRLPIPAKIKRSGIFRIVKFGHLDTWTQRNAEYLATLVELTNLYDPDLLLISNEANWQYVSGALNRLHMPYLITSGNHGLPGFESYYGEKIKKVDIGPVTIVVYNSPWVGPSTEVEKAFASSPNSTFRILQGVESDIDQEWAKCLKLNLYLCAHGFKKEHASTSPWLHLGKEFNVVDINLSNHHIEVIKSPHTGLSSREKYPISREFPFAPIVYKPENNGKHDHVKAHITSPMLSDIHDARVIFNLPKGEYISSLGKLKILEENQLDNSILAEVRVNLPAKSTVDIQVNRVN